MAGSGSAMQWQISFQRECGVLTGKPADSEQEWYAVPQIQALEVLGVKQPAAVAWWNAHGYPKDGRVFCFYEDEAVVLPGENPQNAWG